MKNKDRRNAVKECRVNNKYIARIKEKRNVCAVCGMVTALRIAELGYLTATMYSINSKTLYNLNHVSSGGGVRGSAAGGGGVPGGAAGGGGEMVNLPDGSLVIPNDISRQIAENSEKASFNFENIEKVIATENAKDFTAALRKSRDKENDEKQRK